MTCECTTVRINGAKPSTIDAWQCFSSNIRDYIKERLLVFYLPLSLSLSLHFVWTFGIGSICLLFCCVLLEWILCCDVVCEKKKKIVDNKN